MMPVTAQAFWATAPHRGEIREVALPVPRDDEVLVRTRYSAISRGTESLVFAGAVPASEHQRMRAPYQDGEFTFPVKYGYINVGVVESGPPELLGQDVFCLYPHQTHFVVPASAVTALPPQVPATRAVLTANLETAVNIVWDAEPAIGDRIAVIGAGVVGCLVAWLLSSLSGAEVQLIDTNPARRAIAAALGVAFATPDTAEPDADVVIHTSGNPQGLQTGLTLAGFEARIVEASWFGAADVTLPLGGSFHSRRLKLISSQVAHLAPAQRSRWDPARRLTLVMKLLGNDTLDQLITHEGAFEQLPTILQALTSFTKATRTDDARATLCHRIHYP